MNNNYACVVDFKNSILEAGALSGVMLEGANVRRSNNRYVITRLSKETFDYLQTIARYFRAI